MTNSKLFRIGTGLAIAISAAACNSDKLTNLNANPNSPEDVPAGPLFTNAARLSVSRWMGTTYSLRQTEWLSQHLAQVQYNDEDRYLRLHAGDTEGSFNGAYSGELKDFTQIIAKGKASNAPGTYAPATIMRTWGFMYLTDSWGDVPYFSALKGDSIGGSLSPKYDAQKAIYADFFAQLDAASKGLTGAANTLGSADPIYGGSVTKWQKFANSLRARLALRLVNVDPATATAQLSAAFSAPGGVFTSNADNATLKYPGDGVYDNPFAVNYKTRDDHRMSLTMINLLVPNNDPRLSVYAQPVVSNSTCPALKGTYVGSPNGISPARAAANQAVACTSRPGVIFFPSATAYGTFPGATGTSLSAHAMTYGEVAFIQAEAAARGLGGLSGAQAAGFYNAGVTASITRWGKTAADASTFLEQPAIAYQGGAPGLVQIAVQKWIALYGDGGSAWSEWRRTCQPATVKPGVDAQQATVPRRFEYGVLEYTVNATNVAAATAAQGADTYDSRVYWDKSPTTAPTYVAGCGTR